MGNRQMAGWKGSSAVHLRMLLMSILWQASRRGLHVGLLLMDISGAFDVVHRQMLKEVLGGGAAGRVGERL